MQLTGKVITKIFYNESNGYTIMIVKVDKNHITAVGETFELEVGDEVLLDGKYEVHKSYGEQFKFTNCIKVVPKDKVTLIQYIADNVKGIGKKIARSIVETFGEDTVNVIRLNPDKLNVIPKLNEDKIERLQGFFIDEWEKWNTINFLSKYNISILIANRIYESLGNETIDIVKEDPYKLLNYVKTIDFKIIDEIGLKQGINKENPSRICNGILYALNTAMEFGHTSIEEDIIRDYASKILDVDTSVINDNLIKLRMEEKIHIDKDDNDDYITRQTFYLAEKNISENIAMKLNKEVKNKNYDKEIEKISKENNIELSDEQKSAINICLNNNISIITGGPGTGKTTIIKFIVEILTNLKKKYILAAPTGRAAKRITETSSIEAKTLHRLLEIVKIEDGDIDSFLNYVVKAVESDYLIVDESSMIDTLMMNNIFKSLSSNTRIIFVGDVNQLPSVGPGSAFKDMIETKIIPTVFLKQIYRQSRESDIILNSHRVNNGEYPIFKSKDTDMFFIKCNSIEKCLSEIESLISYRLENFAKIDVLKDLQILTPTKKTDLGTYYLNKLVQKILNPKDENKSEIDFNSRIYRVGDKVMQIVNNYDREYNIDDVEKNSGIYNGDIGFITEIDKLDNTVTVIYDGNKKTIYEYSELEEIEHAYAITVHKSQGSEYDYVIMPIFQGYPKLFTRNLLYTAMTRAKKMLIIVGNQNMVNFMVDNLEEKKRKTMLKKHIYQEFENIIRK